MNPYRSDQPKQRSLFESDETANPASLTPNAKVAASEAHDPSSADSLAALKQLADACERCQLRSGCQQVVFGEGNADADLVLVGEGPGADEDRMGRPFVGRAGRLLDRMLIASGLDRDDIYITNIVKCRPPGNRTPLPEERAICLPYLVRQMELIRPKVIISAGAAATQGLLDPTAKITKIRGTWREWQGIAVMPIFHPAALLRDPGKKAPTWEDMKKVMSFLNQ